MVPEDHDSSDQLTRSLGAHRNPATLAEGFMTQVIVLNGGVVYDVEVDTTGSSALACAQEIARAVAG